MKKTLASFGFSLGIHLVAFAALWMVKFSLQVIDPNLAVESLFDEERSEEELTRDLDDATEIAETLNIVPSQVTAIAAAGGGEGGPVGAGATGQSAAIESSAAVQVAVPGIKVDGPNIGGLPGLSDDLGSGQVAGDAGAAVESYGAALSQITQEILRHMRQRRVVVVWLFDESDSMKDDQAEIKRQFHKVYEELGIASEQDKELKGQKEILETVIWSYGAKVRELTPKPTSSLKDIHAAIDDIAIDESGLENTCSAVAAAVTKYGPICRSSKRQLLTVIVTDESGNDGQHIDETVQIVKRYDVPMYILGRESVFGYPYARIRWVDPKYQLTHWLQIDRGPETPFPEALQTDGLHARWDAHSSGFGPYEQARLARETGGVFFVLPGEEENLVGQEAIDKRKFQFLDMKEYLPSLQARREYEQERNSSKFRKTVWDVIARLNPYLDKELNVQESHYSIDPAEFQKQGQAAFARAMYSMNLFEEAYQMLLKVKPLRDKEDSERWRANYDLALAQTQAYRVRLFQFCLALDQHNKANPKPKNPMSNEWNLHRTGLMLEPDAQVVKATKIDMNYLKEQEQSAREQFAFVSKQHPRTPWSNRAEFELAIGFSFRFVDGFRDPRYNNLDIKYPKP